jgi:hypothetical protein
MLRKGKWMPMKTRGQDGRDKAEMLAIQALAFIAAEPERLSRFLDMTGIPPNEMRNAASQPGFLAGVLEHMLGDENLLIAFADDAAADPADIARARQTLGRR